MRISWLEPETASKVRGVLFAWHADFAAHFAPEFRAPPAPPGIPADRWPKLAEHVARAERVALVARQHGLDEAEKRFGHSAHAIERATVLAAAVHMGVARFDQAVAVLEAAIDDLVMYGSALELMENLAGAGERDYTLAVYERFCHAATAVDSAEPMWREWVAALPDALAGLYVRHGRLEEAHDLFLERHRTTRDDIIVALAASRAFLAAGHVAHAAHWVGLAADRAHTLGRAVMARRLRDKAERLRARAS